MPAILSRTPFRSSQTNGSEQHRSVAVANILNTLEHSAGDLPRTLSYREFRELAQRRAQTAEQHVWGPIRVAHRTSGGR